MAETKKPETAGVEKKPATKNDDRVEIFVPRNSNNKDPNLVIVLNGKNYVLPKGQKSMVPRAVAKEYERSKRAQYAVDDAIYGMTELARKQAQEAGLK